MITTYIGIDPGLSGAIAIIDEESGFISAYDMPVIKNKGQDTLMIQSIINEHSVVNKTFCIIEASKPATGNQGGYGRGISTFLINYGKLVAVLEILQIPFKEVHPLTWKKYYSLIKQEKIASIKLAKKLFPKIQYRTERGRWLDGRAESLLLAEYGRRLGNV